MKKKTRVKDLVTLADPNCANFSRNLFALCDKFCIAGQQFILSKPLVFGYAEISMADPK
jgi:hypothetical protein